MNKKTNSTQRQAASASRERFAESIKAMLPLIGRDLVNSAVGGVDTTKNGDLPRKQEPETATQTLNPDAHPDKTNNSSVQDESIQILKDLIRHLAP